MTLASPPGLSLANPGEALDVELDLIPTLVAKETEDRVLGGTEDDFGSVGLGTSGMGIFSRGGGSGAPASLRCAATRSMSINKVSVCHFPFL